MPISDTFKYRDGDESDERFKRLSQMRNVEINVIEKNQMLTSIEMNKKEEELKKRSMESIMDHIDLDNQFMLVIDDSEFITIPPFKSESLTAITSTNKALIFNSRIAE